MRLHLPLAILILAVLVGPHAAWAVGPTAAELAEARAWAAARWEERSPQASAARSPLEADPWFSFTYGGRPSAQLLKT